MYLKQILIAHEPLLRVWLSSGKSYRCFRGFPVGRGRNLRTLYTMQAAIRLALSFAY